MMMLIVMLIMTFEIMMKTLLFTQQTTTNDDLRDQGPAKIGSIFSKRAEKVQLECSKLVNSNRRRLSYIEPENFLTLER